MALLRHPDMRPLSPGFAETYTQRCVEFKKPGGSDRVRNGITAHEFHEALSAIGINGPKDLARVIGCNEASAQGARGYYNNPARLNSSRDAEYYLDKLSHAFMEAIGGAQNLESSEIIAAAAGSVFDNEYFEGGYGQALRDEYRRRALMEGFEALGPAQQDAILDHMRLMLQDVEPSREGGCSEADSRKKVIADSLRSTGYGKRRYMGVIILEGELSRLVRSESAEAEIQERYGFFSEPFGAIDMLKEYTGQM